MNEVLDTTTYKFSDAEVNECFRDAERISMDDFKSIRDAYVAGELTEAQARAAERRYGKIALYYGCMVIGGVAA